VSSEQKTEAKSVANVVHIPTGLAYAWIFLGFVTAGLLLYAFFMAAAFKIKLFRGCDSGPRYRNLFYLAGQLL
jgi:hypothetical protein